MRNRAAIIGVGTALAVAIVGGVVGGIVATSGNSTHPPAVRLVQPASTTSPTTTTAPPSTTTTTAPPTTTTTAPGAPAATTSGTTQTVAPASTPTPTTTAPPTTPTTYCTGSLAGDQAAPAWPGPMPPENGNLCTDSVGHFIDEYITPPTSGLPPGGWYRIG